MPSNAILTLADDLIHHRLAESELPNATVHLPALDEPTLHHLIRQANSASRNQPWQGGAMMAMTNAAANPPDPLIRWHAPGPLHLSRPPETLAGSGTGMCVVGLRPTLVF